jgi:guanylate kinase
MSLVVLVGPAGVGKGSLVRQILGGHEDFMLSVSATTRDPRQGEVDGIHYHFVSRDRFEEMISRNHLLEHAVVHGEHLYGTPKAELERASSLGKHLILEIDLQGARQIREHEPEAIQIFIHPPSWEELERRLRDRATETESEIQTRLATARSEIDAAGEFEHQVTNDNLSECAEEIVRTVRGRDK